MHFFLVSSDVRCINNSELGSIDVTEYQRGEETSDTSSSGSSGEMVGAFWLCTGQSYHVGWKIGPCYSFCVESKRSLRRCVWVPSRRVLDFNSQLFMQQFSYVVVYSYSIKH